MGEPNLLVTDERESEDTLALLARRWYILLICACVCGAGAYLASSRLLKKTYESTGAVFVDKKSSLNSALSSLPIAISGSSTEGGYVVTLLTSETMVRRIVNDLDLSHHKAFTDGTPLSIEKTQMALKKAINVKLDKNGAVAISVRTTDPDLCAKIINHLLNNLASLYETKSEKRSKFLTKKIKEVEARLAKVESKKLLFETQNDISLIDEQTKETIRKLGELDSQLIGLDLQLQQTKSELQNQGDLEELMKLKVKRAALESSRSVITKRIDQSRRRLSRAPEMALEYAKLQRMMAMDGKTLEILEEQRQIDDVTQHGEDADYQVVDWGQVREEPVGPRNGRNAGMGAALGVMIACLVLLSRKGEARRVPVQNLTSEAVSQKTEEESKE